MKFITGLPILALMAGKSGDVMAIVDQISLLLKTGDRENKTLTEALENWLREYVNDIGRDLSASMLLIDGRRCTNFYRNILKIKFGPHKSVIMIFEEYVNFVEAGSGGPIAWARIKRRIADLELIEMAVSDILLIAKEAMAWTSTIDIMTGGWGSVYRLQDEPRQCELHSPFLISYAEHAMYDLGQRYAPELVFNDVVEVNVRIGIPLFPTYQGTY